MEDEKTHHNLLQRKPPSSSSSLISNHLSTPPDVDALLGLINLPTSTHHEGVQISPRPYDQLLPYPLISSHISSPSSLFSSYSYQQPLMGGVGYGVVQESTEISPSCSALGSYGSENLGAARTHHAHLINSDGPMGGKKRKMNKGKVVEKPGEVIHVRAKRGQATDSHSLAERVRRERINEKLRVLQDLVPGCYKTMGMAVMLDVIINYVRSLQNQIEFLSMKLSAASVFYDFNSPEAEAIEAIQKTNLCELREIERMMTDQVFEGLAPAPADQSLHSTWPL